MLYSIVIPMYNEKAIAKDCAAALTAKLESWAEACSFRYEILFSDDGSTDGCGNLVQEYAAEHSLAFGEIRLVRAEKNAGKGNAVRLGVMASRGDIVAFTDSDLAYGCDVLIDMYRKMSEPDFSADLLIGSRAIAKDGYAGYTFMRKLASKTYIKLLSLSAGFHHSDSQCGIKLFRGEAARRIFSLCEVRGWAFDFEALLIAERLSYQIAEFPVTVINHRESKVSLVRDSIKMMADVRRIKKRVRSLSL